MPLKLPKEGLLAMIGEICDSKKLKGKE